MSVGGPPKAVLGGPKAQQQQQQQVQLQQQPAAPTPAPAPEPPLKGKKILVKVPKESSNDEDGSESRPTWARNPIPTLVDDTPSNWEGLEISTGAELDVEDVGPSRVNLKSKVCCSIHF
jgi:hypothetical protein